MTNIRLLEYAKGRANELRPRYTAGKNDLINIIELVGKMNAGFDKINSEFSESTDCSQGCSHCCSLSVDVMAYEVVAIYEYVNRTFNSTQEKELLNKIDKRFDEISSTTIEEEKKIPSRCPLLNDQNKCSVYPVRPSNCAGMVSNDSRLCEEWIESPSDDIQIETPDKIVSWRAVELKAIQDVANECGDTVEHFSLARALHAVFNRPSLVKRWKKSRNMNLGPRSES